MTQMKAKPFLKWAGGKFRIIDEIRARLPQGARLIEPFAGSGAVFLNTDFDRYLLTDSNPDLITLYQTLKREGQQFIDYCTQFFTSRHNRPETYYALREEFNHTEDVPRKAALFIYLNRHGYNGLCRYNAKGRFNVPFGRYKRPYFPAQEMLYFHRKARRATFRQRDFQSVIAQARPGDVIYCDPPYVPLSASANFTSYSASGFDLASQTRLTQAAARAARKGIPVLISNHDTPFTQQEYQDAEVSSFQVRRFISCNGARRKPAGELLALFS